MLKHCLFGDDLQASSPACTELETITMDWLGKMVGLPTDFLHSNEQTLGGGVIQVCVQSSDWMNAAHVALLSRPQIYSNLVTLIRP